MYENVLKSGYIGKTEIKNRFIVPPMDSSMTDESGRVNDRLIAYYRERAKGGFGLVITEYTCVDRPDGLANPTQLSISDDSYIPGMKKLADAIHEEGGKIFVQLQHPGRETTTEITGRQTIAPSSVPSLNKKGVPRALSKKEIKTLVEKFAQGARRAKEAGMDGVEVQCGHGYLVAQFLSGISNKRLDEYGGSLENRARFASEIVRRIKKICGDEFPISCRISGEERISGGLSEEDATVIAKIMEKSGADAIHVSTGTVASSAWLIGPSALPNGFNLSAAQKIKKAVHIPVIAVGRITEPALADRIIEDGIADFVSLGRASIADPALPKKTIENRVNEICPCVGCLSRCFYTEGVVPGDRAVSCMLNPFSGHEDSLRIEPTQTMKKVVVVGGGPGGLEAAWVSAAQGHKVLLFEKEKVLGGQLRAASIPPRKQEIVKGIQFLTEMNLKYGVDIRLGVEASKETVERENPDVVILATGATPVLIPVPMEGTPVVQAIDLLNGKILPGEMNVVIGGGLVGLETASYIVSQGYKAVVIEMKSCVGEDLNKGAAKFLLEELDENNVEILTSTKLKAIGNEGVLCETAIGDEFLIKADCVVSAIGSRAYNPLEEQLQGASYRVVTIGDAVKARKAYAAIEEGARTALSIR